MEFEDATVALAADGLQAIPEVRSKDRTLRERVSEVRSKDRTLREQSLKTGLKTGPYVNSQGTAFRPSLRSVLETRPDVNETHPRTAR